MTPAAALCQRYLRAQLDGDRRAALATIDAAIAEGLPIPSVHLDIVQQAQYEVGRLWETNAISIAAEHQATAISQLVLARLYDQLPRAPRHGRRVLVSCVEGEMHDVGVRIAADFLEMDGFDVLLLGANTPTDALAERIRAFRPDAVALSAAMTFHLPATERAVAAVKGTLRHEAPVLVGGRAFTLDTGAAHRLGVQGTGTDARELVTVTRRLLDRGRSS